MKIEQIFTDGVVIPSGRLRHVDESRVDALAESMGSLGLQHPISVWDNPEDPGSDVRIVAGVHRLLAARKLGWTQIDAVVTALGERERRMWEIAENLHRAELTALEHDQHLAEWIRLTEQAEAEKNAAPVMELTSEAAAEPERKRGRPKKEKVGQSAPVYGKGGRGKKSGVRAATRELGVDHRDARRALKVASLTEEAKEAARDVGLDDNRSALLKAAEDTPENQAATIREIARGKTEAKRHPRAERTPDPVQPSLQALIDSASSFADEDPDYKLNLLVFAWESADEETRRRFLRRLPSSYLSGVAA